MTLNQTLRELHAKFEESDQKMPALFVGHGNPMNALEDNEFNRRISITRWVRNCARCETKVS